MSQATKRKHVVKEVLGDFVTPTEKQQIMRVLGSPGNNLHEAMTAEGQRFLVSMPTKYRKNIWIKRGDFVIVDPIEEGEKVKAEISFILYKDHIRHLQSLGIWPEGFSSTEGREGQAREDTEKEKEEEGDANSSEEDDSDLFVNTNRIGYHYYESEEESDEDEVEEEEENNNEEGEV